MMETFKRPSNPRIEIEDPDTMDQTFGHAGRHPERPRSPGNWSQDSQSSQDSCHTEEAAMKGYLNVHVRPAVTRSNSSVGTGMPCYTMSASPRGLALIVEIRKYDNDVQDERYGSEVRKSTSY